MRLATLSEANVADKLKQDPRLSRLLAIQWKIDATLPFKLLAKLGPDPLDDEVVAAWSELLDKSLSECDYGDLSRNNKFDMWLTRLYANGVENWESIDGEIVDELGKWNSLSIRGWLNTPDQDFNRFSSDSLKQAMHKYSAQLAKIKNQEMIEKHKREKSETVLMDNDRFYVMIPYNYGSCYTFNNAEGIQANFCTGGSGGLGWSQQYMPVGAIIMVADKTNLNHKDGKWQMHAFTHQIVDAEQTNRNHIPFNDQRFADLFPGLMQRIASAMKSNEEEIKTKSQESEFIHKSYNVDGEIDKLKTTFPISWASKNNNKLDNIAEAKAIASRMNSTIARSALGKNDEHDKLAFRVQAIVQGMGAERKKYTFRVNASDEKQAIIIANNQAKKYGTVIDSEVLDNISEIKMSSGRLAAQAQAVQPTVGIEFELLVPRDHNPTANDFSYNQDVTSIDEILDFFNELGVNTRSQLRNLHAQLDRELNDWAEQQADAEEFEDEELRLKFIQRAIRDDQEQFLDDFDLSDTEAVYHAYDHIIDWPYQKDSEETNLEEMQRAANEFTRITGIPAIAFNGHGGPRDHGKFTFEKDSTVQHEDGNAEWIGAEIVTNRLDLDAAIYAIEKVRFYAYKVGAETNRTCGLHINVSVPNYDKLNYLKLIALIGDEHVLGLFNRLKHSYAPSAADRIRTSGKLASPDQMIQIADSLRTGDIDAVKNALRILGRLSVNFHPDRIELRSPGGDWLNLSTELIVDTVHRLVVALTAAVDPTAYREEYLTKLYKLIYNVRVPQKGALKSVYDLPPMEQYRIGFINRSDLRALMTRKQPPVNLPK